MAMNDAMNTAAQNAFSFFDAAKPEPEGFYHVFVLGLIVDLKDLYDVRSKRASRDRCYDVALFPASIPNASGISVHNVLPVDGRIGLIANQYILAFKGKAISRDIV
ncbi:MAG: hypothetical protein IJU76_03560 [Desulfovibrionaceae bacterium]|nr:hypothetical protein [Desulfovibrionaceae bacterium]